MGQPVLVGTIAVETSEYLSELLTRAGVPHNVLNAKEHAREAEIIERRRPQAARSRSRRTWPAAASTSRSTTRSLELGGLYVSAPSATRRGGSTTSSAAARDARATRARRASTSPARTTSSGCSPATGSRTSWTRFKLPDDQPMEAKILSPPDRGRAEEGRGAELRHAQERPQVRRRDEPAAQPSSTSSAAACSRARISPRRSAQWIDEVVERAVDAFTDGARRRGVGPRQRCEAMHAALRLGRSRRTSCARTSAPVRPARRSIEEFSDDAHEAYNARRRRSSATELMRELERYMILQVVDTRWREHLENMDYLREGVHLRAMAQKDPLVEYTPRAHQHVRGAEPARSARRSCSRSSTRSSRREDADSAAARQRHRRTTARSQYSHEALAGADAIAAAFGGNGGGGDVAGRGAAAHAAGVVARQGEDRPQRPLLVRLRQEVQEVPRRVAVDRRRSAPMAGSHLAWPTRFARRAAEGDRGPARLGP